MNQLDIYYRAFKEYRKETVTSNLCDKDRKEICRANTENDKLTSTKYLCHVEEEWIKTIEEGLVYVEKAVQEERQFIRTNGEVVPIEKVKKISKDSVEHLAKHSDLITHVPEDGGDVIPDKLYMVEKLSDYAVYENRFLYMMLRYLQDFIDYRLEKLETLRRTYRGNMQISKEIVSKKRTLKIEAKIEEARTDNPFPIADDKTAAMVQRIKDCHQIVTALLNTDLMTQVAKSPMIKPPIVKTNVLKMNNNFKRALALYDYVASFKGMGFDYEEVVYDFTPLSDSVADEIAEAANLTSFLAYKYGNDIEGYLEREYLKEEARRREEEARKLAERIKRLKKRALESNKTMEEYMVLLENRNRMLEKDSEELALIRHEIEKLNDRIDALNAEKGELARKLDEAFGIIEEKDAEISRLNQKYIEDIAALKKEHEEEILRLNEDHAAEIDGINAAHEADVINLKAEFADELSRTIDDYGQKIAALESDIDGLNERNRATVEECDQKVLILNEKLRDANAEQAKLVNVYEARINEIEESYKKEFALKADETEKTVVGLKDENTFIRAQLDGERIKQGKLTPCDDYSSRERFTELESEFEAFKKFFREQWKLTKKAIRKEVLWTKPEPIEKDKNKKEHKNGKKQ